MPKIALMIPEFPQQTHIAWWRVGQAMRELGVELQMVSTRRPTTGQQVHPLLVEESTRTLYAWPPDFVATGLQLLRSPLGLIRTIRYILGLRESSVSERLRKLALILPAANLAAQLRRRHVDHLYVHSCADAAHVAALCRLLGGPEYSLRLGGDLEVYGKDHASKMRDATLIVPGASAYIDRLVSEIGLSRDKIMWTWVGVDTRKFRPNPQPAAPRAGVQLATVARLSPTKGHRHVLRAIADLVGEGVDLRYVIAGNGPEESAIRDEIWKLDLADRVQLVGALSEQAVLELLWNTDIFVLASFGSGESTPAVVSEAMACGVPAVCTRIGGTMDMIEDGRDGFLVPQEDPSAIREAVRALLDPQRRRAMGELAVQNAAKFDTRITAGKILRKLALLAD